MPLVMQSVICHSRHRDSYVSIRKERKTLQQAFVSKQFGNVDQWRSYGGLLGARAPPNFVILIINVVAASACSPKSPAFLNVRGHGTTNKAL